MYHLLYQSVTQHFVFVGFVLFLVQTGIISLNSIIRLIFVIAKVLFSLRYGLDSYYLDELRL
jgi:hypothetical protein